MYQDNQASGNTDKLKTTVLYVKIGMAVCVFVLGAYITLWSIETIDTIINNTENTSIVKTFLDLETEQKPFTISINNDKLEIAKTDGFKYVFLLLIFIVLFSVIGKAIGGIFKCLASIIVSLNVGSNNSKKSK